MSNAKDAIEAMARIDQEMLHMTHTPQLNRDKRTVMDALLVLDALVIRIDSAYDEVRHAASTNPTHLYPCTDAEQFEREEDAGE